MARHNFGTPTLKFRAKAARAAYTLFTAAGCGNLDIIAKEDDVPLEQFQTQVLLLHSEQSTLDDLSTGFSDRYAVHCATSGIEALNTLGVTPIDVIVSAQDLPGMSGLDALREAKKRSPDTITILMAGTAGSDGLEALVNDKAVYQIIRGEISPSALFELVENATKSARMVALSESANDTSAAVDSGAGLDEIEDFDSGDDTGQHIVMETGDNGACIISDVTGKFPALKAGTTAAGANKVDVLVLTQDEEFLDTVRDSSRGLHKVHHAVKPEQAVDFVRNFPVGVLVTDAALAGTSVEEMAKRLRSYQKRLVAIVAGRRDDGEMLMDLINRGQVYRFLLKPVSPGRARLAIEASVKHHIEAPEHSFEGRPAARKVSMPPPAKSAEPARSRKSDRKAATPATPPAPAAGRPPKNSPTPAARSAAPKLASATADSGLDDAFDEGNSFTETMTGIAVSFGKSLSNAANSLKGSTKKGPAAETAPAKPPTPPAAAPSPKRAAEAKPAPAAKPSPAPTPKPAAKASPAPAPKPAAPAPAPAQPTARQAPPAPTRPATVAAAKSAAAPHAVTVDSRLDGFGDGGSKLPLIIGGAAGLVLAGALAWFFLSGDDAPEPRTARPVPAAATQPAAPGANSNAASNDESLSGAVEGVAEDSIDNPGVAATETLNGSAEEFLAMARGAAERGDIFAPEGESAIEYYLEAMLAAPGNSEIGAELDALVERGYGLAEAALLDNRTDEAASALRAIGIADPGSPRLNFLTAQLDQQRLRSALDDARAAIREGRYGDAGDLLARAETLAGGSNAEVDTLSAELAAARAAQQIDDVLALGAERLAENRLLAPANDNARHYFELAAERDPGNAAARQGLIGVASKLVLQARSAIDGDEFSRARGLLDEAATLDPDSDELAATLAALRTSQEAAENPPPTPAPVSAPPETQTASATEAAPVEARPETQAATRAEAPAEAPPVEPEAEAATASAADAENAGETASLPDAEPAATNGDLEIVSITDLTRTKYVPPQYPRAAQRRNQTGFVDLIFTVTPQGLVSDVEVRSSEPGNTFVNSAIRSVQAWEFEPYLSDGVPVSKRVAVRMSFNLQ